MNIPRIFQRILYAGAIALSVLTVSACERKGDVQQAASLQVEGKDRLIVITPHAPPLLAEFENAFRRHYQEKFGQNVQFDWLDVGGASDDMKFIQSEFAKNKEGINIDILWGGGTAPYLSLKKNGLLEAYQPPAEVLNAFPERVAGVPLYDSNFMWFGSALSSFGFICNQALLQLKQLPIPKTWKDLGDPRFAGVIGSADPRHSGSNYTIYTIILQAYGWEEGWSTLIRMGANVRNFTAHTSDAIKEVITGDSLCGLAIDFYARAKVAEFGSDKLVFVLPEGLSVIDPDSIGILRGAPNRKVAQEFVSFVLSKKGQKLWLLPPGAEGGPEKNLLSRLSILPSLYEEVGERSVVGLNPFTLKGSIPYDEHEADELRNVINDMIGTFIIDIKVDLNRVWQKAIQKGLTPEFLKTLDEMPVSKEKAYEYAQKWNDSLFRNQVINEWHAFNRKKIERLQQLLQ